MAAKPPQKRGQVALAKFDGHGLEAIGLWAEAYLRFEATTSARSRKEQQRDLQLFLDFLTETAGADDQAQWTPGLSRAFVDWLRAEVVNGKRRWSDRTINRIVAHLKTFSKWIHSHRAFALGDPMAKLQALHVGGALELERALTEKERRKILDAADCLPVVVGRSRDKRRAKRVPPNERPQRKSYRPWRNRAIVYTLIESGIRRSEVTSIDLDDVDFSKKTLLITEKGGQRRRCQVSREGMDAIRNYIDTERAADAARWASPALFLPALTVAKSSGRLAPVNVNTMWTQVCELAGVSGRTPHSARHAMGVHIVKKTGNPRAVQRQLGHKNPSTTMQYLQFTQGELQAVLDER